MIRLWWWLCGKRPCSVCGFWTKQYVRFEHRQNMRTGAHTMTDIGRHCPDCLTARINLRRERWLRNRGGEV